MSTDQEIKERSRSARVKDPEGPAISAQCSDLGGDEAEQSGHDRGERSDEPDRGLNQQAMHRFEAPFHLEVLRFEALFHLTA
jgi:hypothetical protein